MEIVRYTREEFVAEMIRAERERQAAPREPGELRIEAELSDRDVEILVHAMVPEGAEVEVVTIPGRWDDDDAEAP